SSITIAWSLRQLRRVSPRELLGGQTTEGRVTRRSALWTIVAAVLLVMAIALTILATSLGGEAQAGAFVGGGAALLAALLIGLWNMLRAPAAGSLARLSLTRLAFGAAQRNPSRSTLTVGLMASACF